MSIFDRLNAGAPPASTPALAPSRFPQSDLPPVGWSSDLGRVIELPRRDLTTAYTQVDVDALENRLRKTGPCVCVQLGRACPLHFRPMQARALLELPRAEGGIVAAGVGHGKTLVDVETPMVMPGCRTAVLFVPASLRAQLIDLDIPYYGAHWHLPHIAGTSWRFGDDRPTLHILTYSQISRPEFADTLRRINPDLIICDEAHNFKALTSARTIRFLRYLDEFPATRLVVLSGTVASRSVRDFAHLAERALKKASPLPLNRNTVNEWASALDVGEAAEPGMLLKLCKDGENAREGFRRRRNDTLGVIWTDEASTDAGLVIRAVSPGKIPDELLTHLKNARKGTRPDGEILVEAVQVAACARQLACGFFHKWIYPRNEPAELRLEWFARRQEFNRELREKLKYPREGEDSPGLLVDAAIRATQGYEGPLPVWDAYTWPAWAEIMNEVQPQTESVWVDDFVAKSAAEWAKKAPGIVWVEFPVLGREIAKVAGLPWYGRGPVARDAIVREDGSRSIIASIDAHSDGRNLQMFSRNLLVTPMSDGAQTEQLSGRSHRAGQKAEEVSLEIYQHTAEYRTAFAKAREYARFIFETDGAPQRLCFGTYDDSWLSLGRAA